MDDASVALTLQIATLVVPNYPCIKGTDILVADPGACARRATPEQRKVAEQVRDTIERIWRLEEEDPARQLFERIYEPLERHAMAAPLSVEMEEQARWRGAEQQGCRLPNELMRRVIDFVMHGEESWQRDADLVLLGRMRLVNKALKDVVETSFPDTLHRYVNRVVRYLLHVVWDGNKALFAKAALASAPLLARATEVELCLLGDEVNALNSFLHMFTKMESLILHLGPKGRGLMGLKLRLSRALQRVRIEALDDPQEEMQEDAWHVMHDIYAKRPVRAHLVTRAHEGPWMAAIRHLELGAGISAQDGDVVASLEGLVGRGTGLDVGCKVDAAIVHALYLDQTSAPKTLSLRRGATADLLAGIVRGAGLRKLHVASSPMRDPGALSLASNTDLYHLELVRTSLDSAAFGLASNTHLRYLGLQWCFDQAGERTAALLRDLSAQLEVNSTLQVLNLEYNEITDQAARELRLGGNTGLRLLSLASNKLSAAGLRSVLESNSTLELVKFDEYKVTKAGAGELSTGSGRIVARSDNKSWEEELKRMGLKVL